MKVRVQETAEGVGGNHLLGLDLLQDLRELLPVVHDGHTVALFLENLGHLLHLLLALLDLVDTNIADARNVGTHGGGGTTLAVLDGNALLRLDTKLLAGVQVDLGVRLA